MKFFSTALAAFAVGSAVAVPVNDARSGPVATPCPCDKPDVPSIGLPAPTPCTTTPGVQATALPVIYNPGHVDNHAPGHVDNADAVAVVHVVLETAISVEAKVKADLELIAKIVAGATIDVQALVKVLVELKVDLKVLLDCLPTLHGLILDADVLVAADLQVVLDLVVRVEALLAEVKVCLKALVALKAEILVVIGVELQACLGLIVSITNPIIEFALALVASLHVDATLEAIIGQITDCVNLITSDCTGITGLLAPVFDLLHL